MKSLQFDSVVIIIKAVTRIFFGGCHVELERRRRENRGGSEVWGGGVPSPENFCIFYFKMVSFVHACMDFCLVFFTVPSYATGSY